MSRIGKQPIVIPEGVSVTTLSDREIEVTGPKGTLRHRIFRGFCVNQADTILTIEKTSTTTKDANYYGLLRTLVSNMVIGVSEGFTKELEVRGVGYKAAIEDKDLVLSLGFSHKINFTPPEGIEIKVSGAKIFVTGNDKQQVGSVAATIRAYKKPEPYKGKGIKYVDEVVRRKAGKAAVKG